MDKLINRPKLADTLDVSESTIARWMRNGTLPTPILLDGRAYWTETDIREWLGSLPRGQPQKPGRAERRARHLAPVTPIRTPREPTDED